MASMIDPELVKQLGTRIRQERTKRHWTQRRLTQEANVIWREENPGAPPIQEKWLWTLEHARMSSTNLEWVAAMAAALEVSLTALLDPAETISPEEYRLRTVLRMHALDAALIEDIVHQYHVLTVADARVQRAKASTPSDDPTSE